MQAEWGPAPSWRRAHGSIWASGVACRTEVMIFRLRRVFDARTGRVGGGGVHRDETYTASRLPLLHEKTEMGDVPMVAGSGQAVYGGYLMRGQEASVDA